MLTKFRTIQEIHNTTCSYPHEVISALLADCELLDRVYGKNRDYNESGGYSIVIDHLDDLPMLRNIINYDDHLCEWATRLGNSGYISALYIMNNDFSIIVFMPESIAPSSITKEIE